MKVQLTQEQIVELAQEIITEACLKIQNQYNQTDGGLAGQFFGEFHTHNGIEYDPATQLLIDYINAEQRMQDDE